MGIKYPGLLIVFLLPALIGIASGAIYVENATVFNFSLNTTPTELNSSIDSVQPRIFTEHIDYIFDPSLTTPSLELYNSLNTVRPRIFTEHIDSILDPSLTTPSLELNNSLSAVRPRIFTEHIDSILIRQLNVTSHELDNSISKVKPRIFVESADMFWFNPLINMTPDPTIPDSITNLHEIGVGTTWINWTWDNPNNTDFGHVIISINGTWKANTSANYFDATGLNLDTTYEIAIKTADIWGNVNESSVQDMAKTLGYVADISPPGSVTNLTESAAGATWINWTWTHPTDSDFSQVIVYLDGTWKANTSLEYYNATGLLPETVHSIGTRSVDTSRNINQSWLNDSASTFDLGEQIFTDDFASDTGMWNYIGSANRDATNGYLVLTKNINYQVGIAWFNHSVKSNFTVDFRYKAGGGSGADGLVLLFYKKNNYNPATGGNLGFVDSGSVPGYGLEFDNNYNSEFGDPSGSHIALLKNHVNNHLIYVNDGRTEDFILHNVKITVNETELEVYLDGAKLFSWYGTFDQTYDGFGLSGATGGLNNWHLIDDVILRYEVSDTAPPAGITDLHAESIGASWINWTWTTPEDADFASVMIYLNGTFQKNVTSPANYYNATGLNPDKEYIISTHTVDTSGNINSTWMNNTTKTAPSMAGDITPPASIKNPHASSFGTTWINWTWTNPSDFDFNHMMLYLDGSFVDNFSETYYNATNLQPGSIHTISTHTVDTSGNINQTWMNDTALTAGDLSNDLIINVYKPENFSVYPVGEKLIFDIGVTNSAGNPFDSGTSAYADLSGPNDASRQIILTKNGSNFTGEYVVQKDDPRGIWTANITAYNTNNSGRVSVKIIIIGAYIIQPTANSRSYVIGETANFTARVVKPNNPSQTLTDNNLSLNMTVYHFNSSTPVLEPVEMLFNDTAGLFYGGVDTGLLGSGLFTVVFEGNDTSGNVEKTSIMIGVSENFSITIGTDRVYYDRGEPVNIYGTVRFDNNSPISNANVSIQLNLQNFKRSYSVITNETGSYNYTFRPFAAEAGTYSVKATVSNIGLQRTAQIDFTIYGLYLAPQSATVNMVENSTQKINFTLYNLGDTKLTGIKSIIKDLDNSDTVTATINPADIPSELLPYNSTSITVQINAGIPVPDKAVFQLEVATDQNSNEVSELNVNLFSPIPIVKIYPENIQIGLNKNQTVIKTVTIANIGYGLLKNITLHQLNNSWSRITSNTSLGDLKPGENASFDVHINSYNVDLGTYYETVNITSDNYDYVKVNLTAYVSDLKNGSLLFHVRDALEKELPDANISLINQETYEEFDIVTNSSGYALLKDLPIGRYIFEVSSEGTNTLPQTGTVEVEAMETPKLIEISLYMSFIDFDWEVIPTSIEDYYNVLLRMRFETDVPIPLLLAFPPNIEYNMAPGEEKTGTFTLYNVGLVSIYNVTISPIKYNGIILDPLITDVGEIKGKSNIQIPYKIKLTSNAASCQELSGKINIKGRYLHFINNHEVISYIGTTVPVLVRTPFDETCKINIPITKFCFNIDGYKFGNQTENLNVDPSTIWFLTGEWSNLIENNSLVLTDVSTATNNNEIGDIQMKDPVGITFSFGLGDIISLYNPSILLGADIIGNGLDIPFFNGIWQGDFKNNRIAPSKNSTLDLKRQTSGGGLTLPELIGGGLVFQFGNTTCYNCIWILPMGGYDASLPRPGGLPNITIYIPQVHLVDGGSIGGGTFCWNCFPDVFIVPTLPHFGGTTYVPWDWPEWVWNVPYSDPIRPAPKPKVTQTIHEVVELSISQNVTMERDAFWAGLGIRNRMPDKNINNVRVNLQIKGNSGLANDKFFIQAPRLKGIYNLDGSGVISPSALAKAQWLMIPKPGAGGANPEGTKYNISANISYSVDGVNFEIATQEVEILVKPQPEIVLDYFIPSDVIANKPFKLAVKATNEGYGPARNFSIETAQPVIYYNPSGLLIDFEIIRSQLQGQDRSTSLKVDFGNIKPGESKLAWWDMVTSIDGTFTEFTGEYTHTSELGGMETSLIKKINTYIIQKQMGNGEIGYDFLANSKSDENYYMLFNSSNGNSTFVNRANYTIVNMPTPQNPVLNVSLEDYTGQWIIVSIENPYNNQVPIEKVIRMMDGTEIPSYNYWMRNGRILIVDHYETGFDGKYSIKFINTKPLKIIVSSPINYGTYAYDGSKILFEASIEGGIAPYDFYWISNLDGDLSSTKSSELSTDTFEKELSEGMHFITLKVTDGSGNIEEQKIRIYVERTTISTEIDSPYSNSCFKASELVKFEGSVYKGIPPYNYKWISDIDGTLKESVTSYEATDSFERQFSRGERKVKLIVTDSANSVSESLPIQLNISDDESTSVCINAMPLTGGLISKYKNNPTIVTLDSTLYFYYKTRPNTIIELELIKPDNSIETLPSTAGSDGITISPIEFSKYNQEGGYIAYLKKVNTFEIVNPVKYYISAYSNVFGLNMAIEPIFGGEINGKVKMPLYSSAFIYGNSYTEFNQVAEEYLGGKAGISIKVPRELNLDYKGSKELTDNELIDSDFGLGISKEEKLEGGVVVGENIQIMESGEVGAQRGIDIFRKWWKSDIYNFGGLRNEPNWGDFIKMIDLMIIPSFSVAGFDIQKPLDPSTGCIYLEPFVTPMYYDCIGRELIELQGLNKYKIQDGNGAQIRGTGANTEVNVGLKNSVGGTLKISSETEIGVKNFFNLKDNSKENCNYRKISGDIFAGIGKESELNQYFGSLSLFNNERSLDSCAKTQKDYSFTIHDEATDLFKSNGNEIKFRSNNPTDGSFKLLSDFLIGSQNINSINSENFIKDFFDYSPKDSIDYTISHSSGYDIYPELDIGKKLKDDGINFEIGLELSNQITQTFEKGYLDENSKKRIIYKKSPNNYIDPAEVSLKVSDTIIKRALMDVDFLVNALKKSISDLYKKINESGTKLIHQVEGTLYYSTEIIGESIDQTFIFIDQINPFKDVHIHVIDQYGRQVYYDYNTKSYINQIPGAQIHTNISINNDTVIKDFIILPKNLKFNLYVDGNEAHNDTEPYNLTIVTGYDNKTIGTIIRDNITKGTIKQFYVDIAVNNNLTINISDPTPYICGNGIVDPNETIINCPLDVDTRPPTINNASLDLINEKIIVKVTASDDVVHPLVFVNANSPTVDEDIPLEYNASLGLYQVELIPIQSDIFNFKVKVYDNINRPPVEQFLKSITIKKNSSSEYLWIANITTPYTVDYYQDGEKKTEIEAFRPFDIVFTLYNGRIEFRDVIAKRINPFSLPAIYPATNVTLSNQTYVGSTLGNRFIELDNLSIQKYLGENATYNVTINLNKFGSTISAIRCDSLLFGQCINEEVIPASNYSEQNEYIILNKPHFSSYGLVYENTKDITPPSNVYNLNYEAGSSWILWKWAKLFEPDFNHTEIYLNGTFITNISAPQNFYNTTGLTPNTTYEFSTRTVDNNGNINAIWVNEIATTLPILDVTIPDTKPPSNITNLSSISGTTWLNFTWLNPPDPDFSHVMLYLNGSFKINITAPQNYYNFTGLALDTLYELGTHTVDSSGNVNETWVNATGRTAPLPDTSNPVINNVTLNNSNPSTGNAILVTVNATDNVAVTSVVANGISLSYQSGNMWNGTIIAEAGTHSVNVSVRDGAGNVVWDNSTSYTRTTP
ncbi:MAG TPA: hypothetical protein VER35_00905, partial [Candidatus Limnocylindrales bacterium]|nr:hypothetical protein [Candidatus Limnocylindrales bacterium]